MQYKTGALPYQPDERDWILSTTSRPSLRDRRFWKMHDPDFRIDQGGEGTCVGHAGTNSLLASPRPHYSYPPFSSVSSAHSFARKLYLDATGDTTYQKGAYVRDVLNVMVSRGYGNYYRNLRAEDTLSALDNGPVVFASPWYNSMYTPHIKRGGWLTVSPASGLTGYHCYLLTGKNLAPTDGSDPFVRMQNSWGPGWGVNGTARIRISDLSILYDGDSYLFTEVVF